MWSDFAGPRRFGEQCGRDVIAGAGRARPSSRRKEVELARALQPTRPPSRRPRPLRDRGRLEVERGLCKIDNRRGGTRLGIEPRPLPPEQRRGRGPVVPQSGKAEIAEIDPRPRVRGLTQFDKQLGIVRLRFGKDPRSVAPEDQQSAVMETARRQQMLQVSL